MSSQGGGNKTQNLHANVGGCVIHRSQSSSNKSQRMNKQIYPHSRGLFRIKSLVHTTNQWESLHNIVLRKRSHMQGNIVQGFIHMKCPEWILLQKQERYQPQRNEIKSQVGKLATAPGLEVDQWKVSHIICGDFFYLLREHMKTNRTVHVFYSLYLCMCVHI